MDSTAAKAELTKRGVAVSENSLFNRLKAGDIEAVALLLDTGISPDVKDADLPAVRIAAQAGQNTIARLLLARGASAEPLLMEIRPKKDIWEKIAASSSILSFISSLLIAVVGGYFTYSYNQRQIEMNRAQSVQDSANKEQGNKVLELEAISKLIPILTASDESGKTVALLAIKRLAHADLAADLADYYRGPGAINYLKQVAVSSANSKDKNNALSILSRIAASDDKTDSKLASRALADVFEQISPNWEKPNPNESTFESHGATCGPSGDGGDALTNVRRNRTDVPSVYHAVSWKALQSLPDANASTRRSNWSDEQLAVIKPYEGIPVSVTGYIVALKPQIVAGESTNCHLVEPDAVDWHIALVEKPSDGQSTAMVVEVTPRVRRNHPKWTTAALAPWINTSIPVRISGFTLLDAEQRHQIGLFRSTLWEIHPITKIEGLMNGQWVDIDNLR